jgi:hypothetical protein
MIKGCLTEIYQDNPLYFDLDSDYQVTNPFGTPCTPHPKMVVKNLAGGRTGRLEGVQVVEAKLSGSPLSILHIVNVETVVEISRGVDPYLVWPPRIVATRAIFNCPTRET